MEGKPHQQNTRISVRFFAAIFQALEARDIDSAPLFIDFPHSKEWLCDPTRTIEWQELCQFSENFLRLFTKGELVELGADFLKKPALRIPFLDAGLTSTIRQLYERHYGPDGILVTTYPVLEAVLRDISDSKLEVSVTVNHALQTSEVFFLFLKGQLMEYPTLQGFSRSKVSMKVIERGYCFTVDYDVSAGLFNRARRFLTRFFTARKTRDELHQSLEKEYRQLESALSSQRISEEKYRLLANNIKDVIWTAGFDLKFTYVSPSMKTLLGYEPEEFMSLPFAEWLTEESAAGIRETIESQPLRMFSVKKSGIELQLIHKDGSLVWVEAVRGPQIGTDGVSIGLIGTYRDITEQKNFDEVNKRLEQQLHQMQKIESIGELAGGIAHDFNNLLMVIQGNAELLKNFSSLTPLDLEMVTAIDGAAHRASKLTQQLLAFGRKQVIEPQIVDINELIVGLTSMLERLIAENIEHVFIPEKSLKKVFVDPWQIEQSLTNLCINARDSMPSGGRLTISTSNITLTDNKELHLKAKAGDYVVIRVADTGVGMQAEHLDQVFEPFFTTKPIGKGTGLGLSVAQGIIDQHGGYVELKSEPGVGSCFSIFLPVAESKSFSEIVPPKNGSSRGTETVLVVEDEEEVRDIAIQYLESAGYQTIAASNGVEGLKAFLKGKPQLVLTDVVMPEMGGVDMIRQILKIKKDAAYIYMSGYLGSELDVDFLLEEDENFIAKPYSSEDLLVKVRSVLNETVAASDSITVDQPALT